MLNKLEKLKYQKLLESFLESSISLIHLLYLCYTTQWYFHSLNYCCIVWGANYFGRLERLLKLQKRMVRIITSLKKRDRTSQVFKNLNVLKVTEIYVLQTSFFMYKLYNRLSPENFSLSK